MCMLLNVFGLDPESPTQDANLSLNQNISLQVLWHLNGPVYVHSMVYSTQSEFLGFPNLCEMFRTFVEMNKR